MAAIRRFIPSLDRGRKRDDPAERKAEIAGLARFRNN